MKNFVIIGATRGLGRAVFETLSREGASGLVVARNSSKLEAIVSGERSWKSLCADMTKEEQRKRVMDALSKMEPYSLIYCAGGGPHGPFFSKAWKDHKWAIELNFNAPSELLHFMGTQAKEAELQFLYVGSAIAEGTQETEGASYVASKRAMVNLLGSVRGQNPLIDIRIFSPGYMNTDLLPKGAEPRKSGQPILSPDSVAKELVSWAAEKTDEWHRVLLP